MFGYLWKAVKHGVCDEDTRIVLLGMYLTVGVVLAIFTLSTLV